MVSAIKLAKRFTTAQAWQGFITTPWEPLGSANTDEEIARYARDQSSTYVDPVDHSSIGANITGRVQCFPRRWNRGDIWAWGSMGSSRPGLES